MEITRIGWNRIFLQRLTTRRAVNHHIVWIQSSLKSILVESLGLSGTRSDLDSLIVTHYEGIAPHVDFY